MIFNTQFYPFCSLQLILNENSSFLCFSLVRTTHLSAMNKKNVTSVEFLRNKCEKIITVCLHVTCVHVTGRSKFIIKKNRRGKMPNNNEEKLNHNKAFENYFYLVPQVPIYLTIQWRSRPSINWPHNLAIRLKK